MNLSIVIPVKMPEPRLLATVQGAMKTSPGAEIVLVFDGCEPPQELNAIDFVCVKNNRPLGTQRSRHNGIMAATRDNVFTCDSHMLFENGWAEVVIDYLENNRKGLCCLKMAALENGDTSISQARGLYKGASIHWTVREPNGYHGALVGKWSNTHVPAGGKAEISCVMGACYGMRKERYLEINKPWQFGTGWGCDEETISMANWLCGGDIHLLDACIGHYMGTAKPIPREEIINVWANRARLLILLPLDGVDYATLITWVFKNEEAKRFDCEIEMKAHYGNSNFFKKETPWARTIEDWKHQFQAVPYV